jgi:hypothetical protein
MTVSEHVKCLSPEEIRIECEITSLESIKYSVTLTVLIAKKLKKQMIVQIILRK